MLRRTLAVCVLTILVATSSARTQDVTTPAWDLFGAVNTPAPLISQSIGFYSEGCLAGGVALPIDGPNWQAMRLERDRNWGHPTLITFIERLAEDAARLDGWPGLLVGDMSQPRGGPMLGGHLSHQTGLDLDIWYLPMPDRQLTAIEREQLSPVSLIRSGSLEVDPALWSDAVERLLHRAASYSQVARIFVHPGIKRELCEIAGADRDWLRVIRPWYGHDDHFHVRLACPPGETGCISQAPPPEGDGCGAELDWWLGPEPWRPPEGPPQPPPMPKTLSDLPPACVGVLNATTMTPVQQPTMRPR